MGRRWVKGLLSTVFLLVLLVGVGIALWWNWAGQPYAQEGSSSSEVHFVITPGMTASQVAQELEQKQLIRNALAFRLLASQQNVDSKLLAGEYNR